MFDYRSHSGSSYFTDISFMNNQERHAKSMVARKANKARRATMEIKAYTLKLADNRITAEQRETLEQIFLEAKWLRNAAIANGCKWDDKNTLVPVLTPQGTQERKLTISSHLRLGVLAELQWNKKSLAASKARGRRVGKLRFTSRKDSVVLVGNEQSHYLRGNRLKITGIPGKLAVLGTKQLAGRDLGGARLLRKSTG